MGSRMFLSILALWIGGYVFNSLIALNVTTAIRFTELTLIEQIIYLLAGGLPVAAWVTIFYRMPKSRRH